MMDLETAIRKALRKRLDEIGIVLSDLAHKKAEQQGIRASGKFSDQMQHILVDEQTQMVLFVGSNVEYAPYVLGGKVPSFTPLKPLKEWIEMKKIQWVDNNGKDLSVEQMAFMISAKHSKEGIPERNVLAEVITENKNWIFNKLQSLEFVI